MSRFEEPDALEAPAASYTPQTRVQIALEARLAACPACAAPQLGFSAKLFQNDEGLGVTVVVRFACEAGATIMITPSARLKAYAVEPCREAMRRHVERITGEAAIYADQIV